jgi:hypothetical protein
MKGMASEEGSFKKDKMWRERVNECGSKFWRKSSASAILPISSANPEIDAPPFFKKNIEKRGNI